MADNLFQDPTNPSTPAPIYTKPTDNFTASPSTQNTIFYLAITKPHTDTYTLVGPVPLFRHLLQQINDIVSNSPSAITKLNDLRVVEDTWGEQEPNRDFEEHGFDTFVVEGQRGVYTVLQILREENEDVRENLPAPVYIVIATGPLHLPTETEAAKAVSRGKVAGPKGRACATRLVGSFVERKEAMAAAQGAMQDMVKEKDGVTMEESWEKGSKGGGMLMAMGKEGVWEVLVVYEDQVLKRAKEGLERAGGKVAWRV